MRGSQQVLHAACIEAVPQKEVSHLCGWDFWQTTNSGLHGAKDLGPFFGRAVLSSGVVYGDTKHFDPRPGFEPTHLDCTRRVFQWQIDWVAWDAILGSLNTGPPQKALLQVDA